MGMSHEGHTLVHGMCFGRQALAGVPCDGSPGSTTVSCGGGLALAGIHKFLLCALLALHIAAPLHLAVAGESHHAALGVVASPAA